LIPYEDYIESTYYIQDEISKEYILSTSYKPRTEYFEKDTDVIWV
jgi:hypothetical protein